MSDKTEPEENGQVEDGGVVGDWPALDPRDRTEGSFVERAVRRILEDVRFLHKNKRRPEEE